MPAVTAVPLLPVKRGYLVWLWIGIALAVLGAAALAWAGDPWVTTASGLRYTVLSPGQGGPHPTDNDVTLVNYTGKLTDGTVFDQSRQPTPMPVSGVVPGFAEALKLMPKGAKYRFMIPPQLGYGATANGPIPANSTLMFDVELVDFIPTDTLRQLQQQQMMRGGGMGGGMGGVGGGMPPGGAIGGPGAGAPPPVRPGR